MGRTREIALPWTQQPQEAVGIDWANPITRGLCFVAVYSDGSLTNLAAGDRGAYGASAVSGVGAAGRTLYATAQPYAASWPGALVTSDGAGTGDYTLLSFSAPAAEGDISSLISQASGSTQLYLLSNTNTSYGASAGTLTLGEYDGNNPMFEAPGVVDGGWHVFVGVRSGTTRYIDCDGVQVGTGTGVAARVYASGAYVYSSGIYGYTNWTRPHPHVMQAAWNRALTPAERGDIGRNPWQVFAPQRILVPTSGAGGGAVPDITFVGAENITATSANYRVTLNYA